jgi:DegV family protein with EDD domain
MINLHDGKRGIATVTNFEIVTDSTADLSESMLSELGIRLVSLYYEIDGQSYPDLPDGGQFGLQRFYELLRSGKQATTSAVNPYQFTELFESILQAGSDILYAGFSSGLSSTFAAGELAARELAEKYPERKIVCIDTLAAALGQGLLVYYVSKMRAQGKTLDETAQWLLENRL